MVESNQINKYKSECDVVTLGHVDVGKSTLCGRILLDLNIIDQRDVAKFKQEAIKNNRESWWLAYLMDQDPYERAMGKTVHVSRTMFETEARKYNLTDCGGHQSYISLMTNSVLQSNFAIILISAVKNEYITSVELTNNQEGSHEGSVRQHFKLLKNSNCSKVLVAINKMDDVSVQWSETVFNERVNDVKTFVQKLYRDPNLNIDQYLSFVPISALHGENVINRHQKQQLYDWYNGLTLLQTLDSFPCPYQSSNNIQSQPLRISIITTFPNDNENCYIARIESGTVQINDKVMLYPLNKATKIKAINDLESNQVSQQEAFPGQKVCLQLQDIVLTDQQCQGSIISRIEDKPCVSQTIYAEISTFLLPYGIILTKASDLIMHIHGLTIPCTIAEIHSNENHQNIQTQKQYINSMYKSKCIIQFTKQIAFEKNNHTLARQYSKFVLRIGDMTVATGSILKFKQ